MSDPLHVESVGTGPPVVLLHGWAMHSGMWGRVIADLASRFWVGLDLGRVSEPTALAILERTPAGTPAGRGDGPWRYDVRHIEHRTIKPAMDTGNRGRFQVF